MTTLGVDKDQFNGKTITEMIPIVSAAFITACNTFVESEGGDFRREDVVRNETRYREWTNAPGIHFVRALPRGDNGEKKIRYELVHLAANLTKCNEFFAERPLNEGHLWIGTAYLDEIDLHVRYLWDESRAAGWQAGAEGGPGLRGSHEPWLDGAGRG